MVMCVCVLVRALVCVDMMYFARARMWDIIISAQKFVMPRETSREWERAHANDLTL